MQSTTQAIASGNLSQALASQTASEGNVPALSSIAIRGKTDGEKIRSANAEYAAKLGQMAIAILIDAAEFLKGKESDIRDYMSGYRLSFDEKSAKVRASEARAVIDAYDKDKERLTAFVARIEAEKIGYHDIVAECRKIRGKRIQNGGNVTPKVTDKQAESIAEKISIASLPQAETIAQHAVEQIIATAKQDWEQAILRQIDALAYKLAESKQPIYERIAEEISTMCAEVLQTGHHAPAPAKASEATQQAVNQ